MTAVLRNLCSPLLTTVLAIAVSVLATRGFAAVDFRHPELAASLTVYPDHQQGGLYYYVPGPLKIKQQVDGTPSLQLFETRYTGTRAGGDQGELVVHSQLAFDIIMKGRQPAIIEAARQALAKQYRGRRIQLRPAPVVHMETVVVYASTGSPAASPATSGPQETNRKRGETVLNGGYLEAGSDRIEQSYWRQRSYRMSLNAADAQLCASVQRNQTTISLSYAVFSKGITRNDVNAAGTESIADLAMRQRVDQMIRQGYRIGRKPPAPGATPTVSRTLMASGVTSIIADVRRWPSILKRLEIPSQLPGSFAVLDLYCFDFNAGLRSELYQKRVEIEAAGAGGGAVRSQITFSARQPEVTAKPLRFDFAVRLDQGFRYRIHEILRNGDRATSKWAYRNDWTSPLDMTTPTATIAVQEDNDHAR